MAEQQTIDQLVGLAVAMLGVAPGTDWLNARAKQIDAGATVDDIANEIQSSTGFEARYPAFRSDERFAKDFLEALLGDNVTDAIMMAAQDHVTGRLKAGETRGEVAAFLVDALTIIGGEGGSEADMAFRELHSGNFGKAAAAFHNKVMVAKHYTEEARMEDPSSSVLEGVTDAAESVTAAINNIDNPPVPAEPMEGRTIELTRGIDRIAPGDGDRDTTPYDDIIVARPETETGSRAAEVLSPSDSIDGGDGEDTIYVYGVEPDSETRPVRQRITNIEKLVIDTVSGIDAQLTRWEGLKSVELAFFGDDKSVQVTVDDGATISSREKFGGAEAALVGASGEVDIEAGGTTAVHIGSAGETESVKVKGGASVLVDNGASSGNTQSQTVASVSVDGVKHDAADTMTRPSEDLVPDTNISGVVVGKDGSTPVMITPVAGGTAGTPIPQVGLHTDGETLTNALTGGELTVTSSYDWNDDGEAGTPDLVVTGAQLKVDVETGGLVFGKITAITDYTLSDGTNTIGSTTIAAGSFFFDRDGDSAVDPREVIEADALAKAKVSVPASFAFASGAIGTKSANPNETVPVGGSDTLTINSDAIEDVHLHNTTASALVRNNSKTEAGRNKPEDLAVTVNKFGSFNSNGTPNVEGRLRVDGAGSAENIMLTVAGASYFDLNSNTVKALDISADARLVLDVSKFADGKPAGASETLASVKVSGEGGVTMNGLNGMTKLASIDASGSSGKNSFKSMSSGANPKPTELKALKTAMGGSGDDTFALGTSPGGKLESVHTGKGDDVVMIEGDYRDLGLTVDLGEGKDTFHGSEGNDESRIDGGAGRDTLRLTEDGATYKDGDDTKSIYSGFEILDLGGGSGDFDVKRLGIDTVIVKEDTNGSANLKNVGAGTNLEVEAKGVDMATTADVDYDFASDVNVGDNVFNGGANILNVSLLAKGGRAATKANPGTGTATLEIDLDDRLTAMAIDSSADVHAAAVGRGVTQGHYKNTVDVDSSSSALESVKITGGAETELKGDGLDNLGYVTAAGSGAGVTVDAGAATAQVRLIGSDHDDTLTSGNFNPAVDAINARNTLTGNGGDDTLTGGAGRDILVGGAGADKLDGGATTGVQDRFVYNAASESQVSFSRNEDTPSIYDAKGYDVISNFQSGASGDSLHFSETLHAIVTAGQQVTVTGAQIMPAVGNTNIAAPATIANGIKMEVAEWNGWNHVDHDGDRDPTDVISTLSIDGTAVGVNPTGGNDPTNTGASNLFEFIGNGRGLFLTATTSTGPFGTTTTTYKNSIAVINQTATNSEDETTQGAGQWLLFDINKDGNFDADEDMVIFLAGATTFDAANDITSA